MLMKTLLIPLAAFAVTVTGASAFSGDMLKRAGLDDEQIAAFEEAKELKEAGEKEAARDVLIAAGVDETVIKQVREAMREHHSDIHSAIANKDYEAFKAATEGSPFADMISGIEEFNRLVEAHELMKSGNKAAAKDIFEELGVPGPRMNHFKDRLKSTFMDSLSAEQKEEIKEAMENKDHERVREIMAEVGIEPPFGQKHHREQ